MKKRTAVSVLAAFLLGAAAVAAWHRLVPPPTPAPSPTSPNPETPTPDPAERDRLLARIRDLENDLARARAAASTAQAAVPATPLATIPDEPAPDAPPQQPAFMEEVASMMQQPEFKEMMRSQQKMVMDQFYGELFKALDLEPDTQARFKDLLADRMLAGMETGMSLFGGEENSDSQAIAERLMAAQQVSNDQIRELLSDEEYALFEQFEETQPERTQVDMFKQSLPQDVQLAWEQEDALILAMHEERTAIQGTTATDPMLRDFPSADADPDAVVAELERLHDRYLQRANDILTPDQVTQFEANLQQQRNMQAMSIRMMKRMMGGDQPAPPTPQPGSNP